jgi:hypothetical protein
VFDDAPEPGHDALDDAHEGPADAPDLDVIEADLAGVEAALDRLDSGEYWRDETTGEPLEDEVLEQHPTARRNPT